MRYVYSDGGRAAAGYKGHVGDCVTRAIAIAAEMPYQQVYDSLRVVMKTSRLKRDRKTPSDGVSKQAIKRYMTALGWKWTPTMQIGSGCTVHLREGELPMGRLVVSVSRHMVAVIDGVVHDNHDSTRGGTRCVYGYWQKP
jgi:hypothetical protein